MARPGGPPGNGALGRDARLAAIRESDFVGVGGRGEGHRIRGGAIPRTLPDKERPFEESETSMADEKVAIGRAAAALVRDAETLLMDVGTTNAAAARALAQRDDLRNVVVFTNGLKTALELEVALPRVSVVILGGTLRPLQHSLVEPM